MPTIIYLIHLVFTIYTFIIIAQVAVQWLVAFDVLNAANPQAQNLIRLLRRLTDPIYQPIRKYVPPIGGIDITPIIILIGLQILEKIIITLLVGL